MNLEIKNELEYLLAELKRIELKLYRQAKLFHSESLRAGEGGFRGLFISENEVENIIGSSSFSSGEGLQVPASPLDEIIEESFEQFETRIEETGGETFYSERASRLRTLQRSFKLSAFEIDTLLICLLPELDSKYQKLYCYLHDDITQKSPTINLILQLLCKSFKQRLMARQAFLPQSPLMKYKLVHLSDSHISQKAPLVGSSLRIDERINAYLLGIDTIDTNLLPYACLAQTGRTLEEIILPDDIKNRLAKLVNSPVKKGMVFYFQGSGGMGKRATAEAICSEQGVPLLVVDMDRLLKAGFSPDSIPLVFREGFLQNAALYLNGFDALFNNENEAESFYEAVIYEAAVFPGNVFLSGEKSWEPGPGLQGKRFLGMEFTWPSYGDRKKLWEICWNGKAELPDDINLDELAKKFRLNGGQIRNAVSMARNLARWRDPEHGLVSVQDIYSACRRQSRHRLDILALKIQPKHGWDDMILPEDSMEQLREICYHVRHRYTVYDDWGFDRKMSLGKGLNVLFAGPSGTGKTMAAGIISHELGLDLYKIDLSSVVSKYIGETEKNLDRIFREGQTSNAILFFDEADALFGKRSEVRDSHDRYANVEIAYLLQKMDEYEGIVILATNLRKNMDDAFARRMHFSIEFPVPDETSRFRIWQAIFPSEAPLGNDIDLHFMAQQFRITGGNIKNIALGAAFISAEKGGDIHIEDLIRATKREYQKLGKLCTASEFGRYFELVRGNKSEQPD